MELYGYQFLRESDLQHHGIKGQKWGKKNGPPYPLDAKDHSASEQKAGWRKSLDKSGSKNATIIARQSKFETEDERRILSEITKQRVKEIVSSKEFKVGMTIAVAAIGTYASYKLGHQYLLKMGNDKSTWLGKAVYDMKIEELSEFPKNFNSLDDIPKDFAISAEKYFDPAYCKSQIGSARTAGHLIHGINEHGWGTATRSNNCTFCSSAIVMRLKGYNVNAGETLSGFPQTVCSDFWEGSKFQRISGRTKGNLENIIKTTGDGHYGIMSVRWKSGGGHSLAYAIRNNRLEILDGQINKVYVQGSASYEHLMKSINIGETAFADLTNCNPTDLILKVVKEGT